MKTLAALALLALLGTSTLMAQSSTSGVLLVLSKGALTLSMVDPATSRVLGRAPSGPDPHEVVASTDGRVAYIANYNGGGNIITVIDLGAMKALAPIDLGPLRAPHGLAFVAGKLWFTAESAKVVGSYDPATSKVDWVLGTGQNRTHMIWVAPDLQRMVTTNVSSATISIIERAAGGGRGGPGGRGPGGPGEPPPAGSAGAGGPARGAGGPGPGAPAVGSGARGGAPGAAVQTDWNLTVLPVGRGAEGFDVSPDGKELWAANAQDGTVSVIDLAAKTVVQTLAANVTGANRLKFTPDGKQVLISSLSGPELVVLDAGSRREVKRLPIGRGAAGIQVQPDGKRAYVACTPDNSVAVVDLQTWTVVGRIDAGPQPDGLAWAVR